MVRCCPCGARIARDNPAALCSTCASRAGVQWLELPWLSPAVHQALRNDEFGLFVRLVRDAAGLTQRELEDKLGYSVGAIAKIEHGERNTLHNIRKLRAFVDALGMPRTMLRPLLWQDDDPEGDVVDLTRRQLAHATLAAIALGAFPPGIAAAPSTTDASRLRAIAEELYLKDQRLGGGALLREASQHLYAARQMLDESDLPEARARELMAAVGELTVCAGWLAYDGGDHGLARLLVEQALALGDQARNDELRVHAQEVLALLYVAVAGR